MSKRTDRIVRDLAFCSIQELMVVGYKLYVELGSPTVTILLSIIKKSENAFSGVITLTDLGPKRILVVKALHDQLDIPLKNAKELTENLPKKLPKATDPVALVRSLQAAGATVKTEVE